MKLPFIVDDIIIALQGAIRTTETKFSAENIIDNVIQYRAILLRSVYAKTGRIIPQWTQQYVPDFDAALQDENNIVKYAIPKVIELDEQVLGFLYIGSKDCLNQYRVFRSRAEYASFKKHRVQRESTVPVVIYSDEIMEIHNTKLKKIDLRVDSIFERPMDLPTYNSEMSEFPLDEANYGVMKKMVIDAILGKEAATPIKRNQNNTDITTAK